MTEGKKNDQNNYEKVDYSLIPLDIIERYVEKVAFEDLMNAKEDPDFKLFSIIHDVLNFKIPYTGVIDLLDSVVMDYGIKNLAVSLGVGIAKYKERGNWMKFDREPERFLKATLRHLMAIIQGDEYDGEEVEGYPQGNSHRGAICFSLMVASHIIKQEQIREECKNGM